MYRNSRLGVGMPVAYSLDTWSVRLGVAILMLFTAKNVLAQVDSRGVAGGRFPEQMERLRQNVNKLDIRLQLDRTEYFPDEDAELTVTIRNPGQTALEVPVPFYEMTGYIVTEIHGPAFPKNSPDGWGREPQEYSDWDPYALAPSRWLQPGASEQRKYRFSDDAARYEIEPNGTRKLGSICARTCNIPLEEGQYRFCYTYSAPTSACVAFQVVYPELVSVTPVRLERAREFQPRLPDGKAIGAARKEPRVVHVLVLRHEGQHIVAVSVKEGDGREIRQDGSGRLTGEISRQFGWFQRVGVSAAPIRSLQAVADAAENITIRYVTQENSENTVRLDARRRVIR